MGIRIRGTKTKRVYIRDVPSFIKYYINKCISIDHEKNWKGNFSRGNFLMFIVLLLHLYFFKESVRRRSEWNNHTFFIFSIVHYQSLIWRKMIDSKFFWKGKKYKHKNNFIHHPKEREREKVIPKCFIQ